MMVQTLGHEKVHITVMLCARANGTKCRPFVLLNRKRPVPAVVQKFSGRLVLSWAGRCGWTPASRKTFCDVSLAH